MIRDRTKLIRMRYYPDYPALDNTGKIILSNGQSKKLDNRFIAVGIEKSRAAQGYEDLDCFNLIVCAKDQSGQYYLTNIEHPADILSPKYIEHELNIHWVKDINQSPELTLIDNLYALNDSRSEYTLTVAEKSYEIYEKYLSHKMSVGYEIWDHPDRNDEASPFLRVRCQLESGYISYLFEDLPMKILEYEIYVGSLLKTSVLQFRPFEIWNGNVSIDGVEVVLESK